MKVLYIDIETTPNTVHRWGMYDSNPVYPVQLIEAQRLLCFAAKWKGSKATYFFSPRLYPNFEDAHREMVQQAHSLLSEADVVVTYNGSRHDIPMLNREFALYEMAPPAPYTHLDLYRTVRRKFKFPFGKLDYVAQELKLGRKVKHEGHELWIKCMQGDEKAWQRMARYNRQDVKLLEVLDDYLKPWEVGTANARLVHGDVCPTCGSGELRSEGYALLSTGKYQRYQCKQCGAWSRSTRREDGTNVRSMS